MKLIPKNATRKVTRTVGRTVLKTKKNSPHIFFVGGVVGVVGSTFLACRATLKLEASLDEIKSNLAEVKVTHKPEVKPEGYDERAYVKDLVRVYGKSAVAMGKLYGPSAALAVLSIAALTGSHIQLTKRNAALTATLAAFTKAFNEYRMRVQEELGDEREREIYNAVHSEKGEKAKEIVKVFDPNGLSMYAVIFDEANVNWVKSSEMNRLFLQAQQNYWNQKLQIRGHVFLNEVYEALGFDHSEPGQLVGWVVPSNEGDNHIDFGLYEAHNSRFINGKERSIILDFNVDGVVFDKI